MVRRSAEEVFGRRITPWWVPWGAAGATAVALILGALAAWQLGPWGPGHAHAATPVESAHAAPNAARIARGADATAQVAGPLSAGAGGAALGAAGTPRAIPTVAAAPATGSLAGLLAQHVADTDPDSAFGRLFALWGAHYVPGNVDPCTQASEQGLECFVQRGSFAQLRLYNRPAILMLSDDSGMPHQVVLSGLDDEHAQIDLGGAHSIGILDLSHYWLGDFVLLWRPDTRHIKPLSLGMQGEDVRRLRLHLERLSGKRTSDPPSDLFDVQLGQLVREFQRTHRLTVDGVAGVQTLVVLNGATAEPNSPLLQMLPIHGG